MMLVKSMLAMRNRDGGMIAVGFDNDTGSALPPPAATNWASAYHPDTIQGIVGKHASQQFEVAVEWFTSAVGRHPVIIVDRGVRTPVAVRSPITVSGKQILPMETVYVRTLNANNTPSSAPATHRDWEDIIRICFDNREADIGRFVRRHLSPTSLSGALAAFGIQQLDDSLHARSLALLDDGERRFQETYTLAGVKPGHEAATDWGYNAVALVVSPSPMGGRIGLAPAFLEKLYSSAMSSRSMIPPWHDGRLNMRRDTQPYTKDGAYQMLLDVPDSFMGHFEFSRLDPKGEFYCRSAMKEETRQRRFHPLDTPTLDPGHAVARVAETFLTGASFARGMGAEEDATTLGYSFRWGKLLGRKLSNWNAMYDYDPSRNVVRGDDQITASVEVPLSVPPSALAQYVAPVVSPLLSAFGWAAPDNFVEHFTGSGTRS